MHPQPLSLIEYINRAKDIIDRSINTCGGFVKKLPSGMQWSSVATLGIFFKVFFKKHKLHNLIKKEIHILTTITIKKQTNT